MGRKDDFEDEFLDPDSDAYDYKPVTSTEGGLGKTAKMAVALSVLGAGALGTWYFMKDGPVDPQNIPIVRAQNQDFKQKPSDPGGMDVPNRDKTVYTRLAGDNTEPRLERLLPRAEQPIEKPFVSTAEPGVQKITDPESGHSKIVAEIPSLQAPAQPIEPAPLVVKSAQMLKEKQQNAQALEETPSEELASSIEPPSPPSLVAQTAQSQSQKDNAPRPLLTRTEQESQPATETSGPTAQDQDALVAKIAEALGNDPATETPQTVKPATQTARLSPPRPAESRNSAAPAPKSGFLLQLLSSKSEAGVQKSLKQISNQHQDLIGSIPANVVRADLGAEKGIYYRLRLGPIADGSQAKSLCNDLKARKVGCFIVKVQ